MQQYLETNIITNAQKKFLYRLRVRMVNVGNNMGLKIPCPLCKEDNEPSEQRLDSQEHLIYCEIIKLHVPEIRENIALS